MSTLALPSPTQLVNLDDPLERAVAGFLARCKTTSTFRAYQLNLRIWAQWCLDRHIAPLDCTKPILELYARWLEQESGWAQATCAARLDTVCLFLKECYHDELIAKDPTLRLGRIRVDKARQKRTYLTSLQMAKWMEAAKHESPTAVALGAILGEMGLRIAEACSLNIEDMRQHQGWTVITFTGKGHKQATVPFPVPVLRHVLDCIGDRTEGPILTTRTGRRMERSAARRLIRKVALQAGIPTDLSPHSFRRTLATTLLQQGVPLYEVQKAMRHADAKTTTVYDRAANSLDKNATHIAAAFFAAMDAA